MMACAKYLLWCMLLFAFAVPSSVLEEWSGVLEAHHTEVVQPHCISTLCHTSEQDTHTSEEHCKHHCCCQHSSPLHYYYPSTSSLDLVYTCPIPEQERTHFLSTDFYNSLHLESVWNPPKWI